MTRTLREWRRIKGMRRKVKRDFRNSVLIIVGFVLLIVGNIIKSKFIVYGALILFGMGVLWLLKNVQFRRKKFECIGNGRYKDRKGRVWISKGVDTETGNILLKRV